MRRKRLNHCECPVARCVDQIGDWWSILILRDAIEGTTRFEAFEKSLEIAPTILTRRLKGLVDDGLLQKNRYCAHPPRYEYLLTEKGRDFQPVLFALLAWGNKHFAPEGASVLIMETATGAIADPILVDRHTGNEINDSAYELVCGPAASAALKERLNKAAATPKPKPKSKTKSKPAKSATARRS